ncbi:leucyl aminopeptidase [Candidatus Roizmanbacteria bacterium]|nr:leucyl aminopeptidase [Candidatus Roizmanbacteria bacterium]
MIGRVSVKKGLFPQKATALIHLLFEEELGKDQIVKKLDRETSGKLQTKIKKSEFKAQDEQILAFERVFSYDTIFLAGLGKKKDFTLAKLKNAAASSLRQAKGQKLESVALFYFRELGEEYFEVGKNLGLAYYLSNYEFNKYKSKKAQAGSQPIRELTFYVPTNLKASEIGRIAEGAEYAKLLGEGIYLARNLVNEPASHLGPEHMVEVAFQIEKESRGKVKVEVLDRGECKKLGMGAYLGVAQGSDREPKFIVLRYQLQTKKPAKTVSLVGKTIIFDSGGLSLKPSKSMEDMKMDMAGGATVLGVFKILARLDKGAPKDLVVFGVLPACENMPSGKALKPGDIVQAHNGKTIEVLNTDAEGRLTLADGLSYAEKHLKSDYLIDVATLTGACMVALGSDLSGLFANDEKFGEAFQKVAEREGDELWPLPLYKPYAKKMKSEIADLKNVGGGRYAGAITAALFLSEFVEKAKWIHIDIAGPALRSDEPKGVIGKGGTGWGVLSIIEFIKKLL